MKSEVKLMENVTIKNERAEQINNRIIVDNRNNITITGITKMISSNETMITMLVKTTKLVVNGKDLKIERLDVENGLLEASGTIDAVKYLGGEGVFKRIFK